MTAKRSRRRRGLAIAGGVALLIVAAIAIWLLKPVNVGGLSAQPDPADSYDEAVRRIEALRQGEAATAAPECKLSFLTHGARTARAIVFVNGWGNCSKQYRALAPEFYDRGYNVLTVTIPGHHLAGGKDEPEHMGITAEALTAYADEVVDIAQGLGDHVTVAGLSAGGSIAAWVAQNRADADRVVLFSPAIGFQVIPTRWTLPATNLFLTLPNVQDIATRGLAQVLRLGYAVRYAAEKVPPAAPEIVVVTNAADDTIDNALIAQLVDGWQRHGANLQAVEFPATDKFVHDFIDPAEPGAQVEAVYPRLLELLGQ
jgi:carboxylesterase